MTSSIDITILVPSYNEEEALPLTIHEAVRVFAGDGCRFEVLIVDDGSTDGSVAALNRLAAQFPDLVRHMRHDRRLGMGAALASGFREARGEWIAELPGDGQFDPADVLAMVNRRHGVDGVVGVVQPTPQAKAHRASALRRLLSWSVRRLIRTFHPNMPAMSGVLVVRRDLIDPAKLVCTTGFAHSEILDRGRRRPGGAAYLTAPNRVRPRLGGQSKTANVSTILKIAFEIAWLRIRYLLP